jgi:hypothetical protein
VSAGSRLLVAGVAVLIAAWTGYGALQYRWERDGSTAAYRFGPSAATQVRADRQLRRAGRLNPDSGIEVARGVLAFNGGSPPRAEAILRGVVADEPQNIQAWAWLERVAKARHEPQLASLAHVHVLELRPLKDS